MKSPIRHKDYLQEKRFYRIKTKIIVGSGTSTYIWLIEIINRVKWVGENYPQEEVFKTRGEGASWEGGKGKQR